MSLSFSTLLALIRKELLQATRDKRVLAMLTVLPLLQVTVLGFAANLEFNHASAAIVDQDHTAASRAFARALAADGTFATVPATDVAAAEALLRDGVVSAALVIPASFEHDVESSAGARVQALLDGSDPSRGVAAGSALERFAMSRYAPRPEARPAGIPRVRLEPRLLYNPGLKSRLFMVPGTAASVLLVVTTIVTAMGLAREREVGTLEQLLVTPLSPLTLLLGKTIPYAMFGLVDVALILLAGNVVFDVPMRGSLVLVFAGALAYLTATLGMGLLLATLARTQQQALMAGFFFLLPAILLSGFLTPVSAMPGWAAAITAVNPIRYFVEIMRTVLLRAGTAADVAPQMAKLLGLAVGILATAVVRFRRTLG